MKIILIFIVLCFAFNANGQTSVYHPFPDSNAIWNTGCYVNADPFYGNWGYNYILSNEDTTIGINQYKKIFQELAYCSGPNPGYCNPGEFGGLTYYAALRQNSTTKKVFLNINGVDTLIYDFSLNIGDTIKGYLMSCGTIVVDSIDSVLIGNEYRKRWNLCIIEGIGSTFGVFETCWSVGEAGCNLGCFAQDNILLYGSGQCEPVSINDNGIPNKFWIFPNPVASTLHINNTNNQIRIINNTGKTLLTTELKNGQRQLDISNLDNGIYFLQTDNGKTQKLIIQH